MSYFNRTTIQAADNFSVGAFGRFRVANLQTLFDSKQIHDKQPLFWDDQEVSGGSTSSTYSSDRASTDIAVGATTAGNRTRQTFQRFNYQPGKSQLVLMTFVLDKTGGGTGITRTIGYGDDDNGLFLVDDEGTIKFRRRTYVTGSAVDNDVAQSSWNLDTMDGSGPSGVNLDFTKTQILVIDFEWLGVGRVRMGFVVDGLIYYCHKFENSNVLDAVYMTTPNLPLRYEIENDGTGAASSMETICCTVISEGGAEDTGIVRAAVLGEEYTNAHITGDTYAIIGIRLKDENLDGVVKIISHTLLADNVDNYYWELRLNPTVAGTFTYSDETNSIVEIAKGDTSTTPASTNTVTGGTILAAGYALGNSQIDVNLETARRLGSAIDGTRDEIVLCVTPVTNGLNVFGSLTWRELS